MILSKLGQTGALSLMISQDLRPDHRLGCFVLLLIALVAGSFGVAPTTQAADPIAGMVAKKRNVHYQVLLQVRAEIISIDRTVHCAPHFGGDLSNPFQLYYRPDRVALSKRLAGGSGVIVIIPNNCLWSSSIPEGYIPPVAIVDDIEKPYRMDVYVSGVRLTSGDGDVRLLKYSAVITDAPGESGLSDEFAAWRGGSWTTPVVNPATEFWALCGYGIGLSSGERDDVKKLSGEPETDTVTAGTQARRVWRSRHPRFELGTLLEGGFREPPYQLSRNPETDAGYSIVPFVFDGDGQLRPDLKNRGVVIFYRDLEDRNSNPKQLISSGSKTLEVTRFPSIPFALYLADPNIVLVLENISQAWAPRP